MNILTGPATTQIRRKVNELVIAHTSLFPNALTTRLILSGGSSNQLAITTSGGAQAFTVAGTVQTANDLCSIGAATNVTSAAIIRALNVALVPGVASTANMLETAMFSLTTNVKMGNWANAIVGKINMDATGFVTGLAGAICAELDLPTSNPTGNAGTYTCFEGELIVPTGFTSTVPVSFINLNLSGAGKANFDTNGFLFDIQGVTKGSGKLFQDNTAAAASQALKVRINSTTYYIMLTATGA